MIHKFRIQMHNIIIFINKFINFVIACETESQNEVNANVPQIRP